MKLSVIILVRNEADKLDKCLECLQFADEIIVIDNESVDDSVSLATKRGARVFSFKGTDFSAMRNLGAKYSRNNWLLYIDADEVVSKSLADEIKTSPTGIYSAFSIIRRNYYFHKLWPFEEKMVRLIRKDMLVKWQGQVHESAVVKGKIGSLKNPLLHYTHDNLKIMVEKTNLWSEIEADLRIKSGHPQITWWRLLRVMITGFWDSFVTRKGFKAGAIGFIESIYQSFSMFITFAKLWEKQIKKS